MQDSGKQHTSGNSSMLCTSYTPPAAPAIAPHHKQRLTLPGAHVLGVWTVRALAQQALRVPEGAMPSAAARSTPEQDWFGSFWGFRVSTVGGSGNAGFTGVQGLTVGVSSARVSATP